MGTWFRMSRPTYYCRVGLTLAHPNAPLEDEVAGEAGEEDDEDGVDAGEVDAAE